MGHFEKGAWKENPLVILQRELLESGEVFMTVAEAVDMMYAHIEKLFAEAGYFEQGRWISGFKTVEYGSKEFIEFMRSEDPAGPPVP